MFSRSLRQLQPIMRAASLSRDRHSLVGPEFRIFNRLVEDFFREPFFAPRIFTPVEPLSAHSGMQFFKEDGKLVAQMNLPEDVKPENVKIALKNGRLCVSVRTEVEQENFRSVKEFHEELKLDDSVVLMDKLEAFVDSNEGRLRVEAPLKEPQADGRIRLNIDVSNNETGAIKE
ncbi:hypothetical protein BIW11_11409 [Tropilaelaps mercedesae]|uniref:SHSP domain-containing protein n=1 Tax=Tropilaelaps mercedesae TaxID=418985 RepID=A0A1V9XBP0_9ACAR|nr:hypothetical protein BIW11_11409 [Tropilaelaps mercedesae]